jgi:hypothetical protein
MLSPRIHPHTGLNANPPHRPHGDVILAEAPTSLRHIADHDDSQPPRALLPRGARSPLSQEPEAAIGPGGEFSETLFVRVALTRPVPSSW